jgi:hypothetical protein
MISGFYGTCTPTVYNDGVGPGVTGINGVGVTMTGFDPNFTQYGWYGDTVSSGSNWISVKFQDRPSYEPGCGRYDKWSNCVEPITVTVWHTGPTVTWSFTGATVVRNDATGYIGGGAWTSIWGYGNRITFAFKQRSGWPTQDFFIVKDADAANAVNQ